ncbi:MAG: DegV family protein [Adlercreutzia equolifaciens]
MPNVIISADSTCDLSPEQRERHQVRSFPFHIEFRGRDHLDNIDITPQVRSTASTRTSRCPKPAPARRRPTGNTLPSL